MQTNSLEVDLQQVKKAKKREQNKKNITNNVSIRGIRIPILPRK